MNAEMYDYLSTITADYNATLTLAAQGEISEESAKSQVIHVGDDGSEERISFNTSSVFYITVKANQLTEANSGTVFDWYNDPAKANGKQRSFKYSFGDGHTYVCRFDCDLRRQGNNKSRYGLPDIRMKVLGRIADS